MTLTVQVQSKPAKGTRFWLEVALLLAPMPAETVVLDERPVVGFEGKRRRVLVAHDLVSSRALETDLFQSLCLEVDDTFNGELGLAHAMANPPALVMMDVSIHVKDSLKTSRRLRADAGLAEVRVVAITASPPPVERERMTEADANSFLQMPIDPSALL